MKTSTVRPEGCFSKAVKSARNNLSAITGRSILKCTLIAAGILLASVGVGHAVSLVALNKKFILVKATNMLIAKVKLNYAAAIIGVVSSLVGFGLYSVADKIPLKSATKKTGGTPLLE